MLCFQHASLMDETFVHARVHTLGFVIHIDKGKPRRAAQRGKGMQRQLLNKVVPSSGNPQPERNSQPRPRLSLRGKLRSP